MILLHSELTGRRLLVIVGITESKKSIDDKGWTMEQSQNGKTFLFHFHYDISFRGGVSNL